MAEVSPVPLEDPEDPTGIKGKPADVNPVGAPLDSVGPEDTPEGVGGSKILFMASK
mgnify:CR=1 FL=1